ncbi:gluconeogenesis factor YvcK family protein [Texcoconibacillus texcoconensis]|uniref:Gluconeogenesis factor n=1 Tax=Texcoconibacillus texcoconensis TaxID=1095777 RepID=A0A840QPV5_9BACI|nr:YvcK family protein [Texcoconibacillus texcoconensis]MBB5173452.1 putative cofD-like protein [Texcoconibacillus texcoconensis]
MKQAKIVVIGGGTGLSVLLRGLKTFPVDITAIVTVADNGGSSGRLRKELNIPPPGDVRNVLISLAEIEPLVEELFQHRFSSGTGLTGHSVGNILLAGMTSITGDFAHGVKELSKVLNVRGKVIPAVNQSVDLHAEYEDGQIVHGEAEIPEIGKKIRRVFITPEDIEPLQESLTAIEEADLIVVGPGSLYTSILPNLIVPGFSEALEQAKARKVYVCNVMTQPGETDGYSAEDHLQAIYNHSSPNVIDDVVVSQQMIPYSYAERYASEGAEAVMYDEAKLASLGVHIVADDLLYFDDKHLRHDAIKVSQQLLSRL